MASVQAAAAKLDSSPHKVVMMMLESPTNETNKAFARLVEEAYKRMGKDLYLALRVSPTATPQEIKKNYRTLSLLYHPDKSRADTSELFQCLSKAYETLSDETERSKYDRKTFGSRKPGSEYNKENAPPRQQHSGFGHRKESSSAPSSQSRSSGGDRGKLRPAAPYLLRCSHVDHESVTLFWKVRQSDNSVTFELQTRLVHEVGWPKSASGIRNSACRKKNLTPHTAYHFRVRAIDGSGSASAWSVPVTVATTKEPATSRSSAPTFREEPPKAPFNPQKQPYYRARRAESTSNPPSSTMPPPPPPSSSARTGASSSTTAPSAKPSVPSRPVPPPAQPRTVPAPSTATSNQSKPKAAPVPPLKFRWDCTVCKRENNVQQDSCRVCGTARDYASERINNISEHPNIDAVRQRERERFESARTQRDSAEAAARAEFSARGGTTGGAVPSAEPHRSAGPNSGRDSFRSSPSPGTQSARSTASTSGPSTSHSDDDESYFDQREAARKARKARKRAEHEAAQQIIRERKKKAEKEAKAAATNPTAGEHRAAKTRGGVKGNEKASAPAARPSAVSVSSKGSGAVAQQSSGSSMAWKATKRTIGKKFSFGMRKAAELLRKAKKSDPEHFE